MSALMLSSADSNHIVFITEEGFLTHLFGSNFVFDPGTARWTGPVTSLSRTDHDGSTTYETYQNVSVDASEFFVNPREAVKKLLAGDDVFIGFSGKDSLSGRGGDDYMDSGDGDDSLIGDDGNDTLNGGDGVDLLIGGAGSDYLYGKDGTDRLNGAEGEDELSGGEGNDTYFLNPREGGSLSSPELIIEERAEGLDTLRIAAAPGAVTISSDPDDKASLRVAIAASDGSVSYTKIVAINSGSGSDVGQRVEHLEFNDRSVLSLVSGLTLTGSDAEEAFHGTRHGDIFSGGGGNDQLWAYSGDDILRGGDGDDRFDGGSGNDVLEGGNGNDVVRGGVGNDVLDGEAGADVMAGEADSDTYNVDNSGDVVIEGRPGGVDTVRSSIDYTLGTYVENLSLTGAVDGTGNKFDNKIVGSNLANTLSGGIGNDRLEGGGGNDILTGGRDSDTFVFKAGFGHDVITDFAVANSYSAIGPSHDILEFETALFADAAALFANSQDTADGVLVSAGPNSSLLIKNATLAELQVHPEDFHFV
jgi:Ca2+-binding RTX toxin-like protein